MTRPPDKTAGLDRGVRFLARHRYLIPVKRPMLQTLDDLGLMPWLKALPAGLDTELGADSGGLSAGQAQLPAFARVFLKDLGLVVLDETLSRLDQLLCLRIERAIDRLLTNRTGIIITHRLTTVEQAVQILILEQERAVE